MLRLRDIKEVLELLYQEVSAEGEGDEGDDKADDGGEKAPPDILRGIKNHRADKGKMPVVPEVQSPFLNFIISLEKILLKIII